MIKILMVEDHHMIRDCLAQILEQESDVCVIGKVESCRGVLSLYGREQPDVVLMDIRLGQDNGLDITRKLLKKHPNAKVVILTQYEMADFIYQAFKIGVYGYLLKKSVIKDLIQAVQTVHNGQFYISPSIMPAEIENFEMLLKEAKNKPSLSSLSSRELEVLQLIGTGCSINDIAERLYISHRTVEAHRASLKRKLGLNNSVEMARFAWLYGLVSLIK